MAVATTVSADATLLVDDAETTVRAIPVDDGTEVRIEYTHSAQKTPVEDVYVVDGTALQADRSVFHSFGAGLPTDVERTDEGYVVYGTERYDELTISPGEVAGHELVVGDERYDLVAIAEGQVVLSVADRTLVDGFRGRVQVSPTETNPIEPNDPTAGTNHLATATDTST